jgi:Xaa-Pro aminopeptidase
LIKDNYEIQNIEMAVAITKDALKQVEKRLSKKEECKNERDIMAILDSYYCSNNCYRSFPPIVASGNNANTLHYDANNQKLTDLVLIDTGVKYNGYASDITRTYLLRQNRHAEDIYKIVMDAKTRGIAVTRPGTTLGEIHMEVVRVIVQGLAKLGILKGSPAKIIREKSYMDIYPHSTSHFLGLDTHDPFPGDGPRAKIVLQKGMVITIEPGIYLNANNSKIAKGYRGIGIRLEDDVLVTDTASRNLSGDYPVVTNCEVNGKKNSSISSS